jgi:hypothetical protein
MPIFGRFGYMAKSTSRPKPDVGIFTTILGLLLAVFIPILQLNGLEINWEWSLFAYVVILIGFIWTYLKHAVPHCGACIKLFGVLIIAAVLGWLGWLGTHNQYLKQHPTVPMVSVTAKTTRGLPEGIANAPYLRYHILRIENDNDVEIDNLLGRLQMPEPITTTVETNLSPGVSIEWRPIFTKFTVLGTGNHKILGPQSSLNIEWPPPFWMPLDNSAQLSRISDASDLTGVWELLIDKLPPYHGVTLSFLTTDNGDATNYISLVNYEFKTNGATIMLTTQGTTNGSTMLHDMTIAMIVQTNKIIKPNEDWHLGTNELRFSLDGWYEYTAAGKLKKQHFLAPFIFDAKNRTVSSLPVQADVGKWRLVMIEYQ